MIKKFFEFLNEGHDETVTYKVGEIVWVKPGASFSYKENKPRHKWKYFDLSTSEENWTKLKIVNLPKEGEKTYTCTPMGDANFTTTRGYNTVYLKLVPDDLLKVHVNYLFSEDEKEGNDDIFEILCKEIAKKLGNAKGKVRFKNSYSGNSLKFDLWQVNTENALAGDNWDTRTGIVAQFLHEKDAKEFASEIENILKKYSTAEILLNEPIKINIRSVDSTEFNETQVFKLAKKLEIDVNILRKEQRGNLLAKKSGII